MVSDAVSLPPGFVLYRFPFNETAQTLLRQYPGAHWSPPHRAWLVPEELDPKLAGEIERIVGRGLVRERRGAVSPPGVIFGGSLEEKREWLDRALPEGARGVLFCAPSEVDTWRELLDEAWTVLPYSKAGVEVGTPSPGWAVIVVDGAEILSNWDSKQSKALSTLARRDREAVKICFLPESYRGTAEIYRALDFCWPGRFGYWASYGDRLGFAETYFTVGTSFRGKGMKTGEPREARREELDRRLAAAARSLGGDGEEATGSDEAVLAELGRSLAGGDTSRASRE